MSGEIHNYSHRHALNQIYGSNGNTPRPYIYESRPIISTYLHHKSPGLRADGAILDDILNEAELAVGYLKVQTADTIDAFIAQNPSVSDIVKIGIANIFFKKLYLRRGSNEVDPWDLRSLTDRYLSDERNWVHLLINLVRHGYDSGWVTKENKVKIITFN